MRTRAAACRRGGDWRAWLTGFGRALRNAFAAHRDGARLCAIAPPLAAVEGAADAIAAPLMARGLPRAAAIAYQASVISLTLGWSLYEANGPMHAFLDEMMDTAAAYETGLAALVAGFT
ncbi:MAG: TetR/AcrR family transcriptional regulator C-terminal domain-containing protein [Sphingomonas fennica]